jgi:predicted nucleic acid-binding protein
VVVLDACVLYPLPLRDTLLRAAQQNLYAVRWSRRILDEVARNLVNDRRATPEQAMSLIHAMERAFEDAEVPEAAITSLESAMTNEPGDRHVLAAAVASDAEAIVTSNVRHFPAAACEPVGVEVVHPDAFLRGLHERAPAKFGWRSPSKWRRSLDHRSARRSCSIFWRPQCPEFVSQVRNAD